MSNELILKAKTIRDTLLTVKTEAESVLSDKGISTPIQGVPVKQIPDYIKSIWSQDFEFLMNFQMIDQVGDPSIPKTGQSCSDSGIEQDIVLDLSEKKDPLFSIDLSEFTYTPNTVANRNGWIPLTNTYVTCDIELNSDVLIDYKFGSMNQIPDQLIAPESNTNTIS